MTLDSSVNRFTNYLDEREIYKDGGSTMYKSKEFDITIIKCNTIEGNRDIFIGDYSLVFDGSLMCKR